ncbi:MAG: hypothetical protein FJ087_22160, partial [Deltaproteobacteria bacterium]|nr:hypothetical protein [Deltaproteobacteria bacterium]
FSDQSALDPLAVAAARAFEFRPATVDGTPAAVAVTYRYAFDVRPRERAVVHVFRVREKGTRDPVDGVTGIVEENGKTFTARAGRVEVADLPPGTYTFYVPEEEFLEERATFEVKAAARGASGAAGTPGTSDLWLERRTGAARQTVIRAPKEARYVARQTLEASELRRLPGSGGDPLKMIENLPGVGRAAFGGGTTIIYGSHFLDSQVLLDSLPMWWFFHFGGLYSTIHPDFIDRIDYIPAGFDASYGFATGGIVDVKLKDAPLTGLHGSADVNFVHAGGLIGFPYSKDGDLQVAFRRSYVDALVAAVWPSGDSTLATAPRYYDYQVRWQHRFGRRHRVSLFVNGSDDALEVVNKHPDMDDPMFVGSLGLTTWIHGAQFRWDAEPTPAVRNSLAVKGLAVGFGFDLFQAIEMDVIQAPVHVRDQLSWRISDRLRLHAGLDGILSYARFDVTAPQVPGPGSGDMAVSTLEIIRSRDTIRVYAAAPFLSLEWDAFPWWTIVPSVRGTVVFGDWVDGWFEPRLSNRFPVGHGVTLKLAGGLYGQAPPPYTFTKEFGGRHVGPEYATHALLGAEWTPIERVTVTADMFFKWMFDLAEPSKDRTERYTNEGKGRAYGGDVMVRVNPGGPLFGWLAYTYVVAERWDPEQGLWRPGDFDTRHTLNVVASYELPRHWTVGARFRLASGYPYTPIASSVLDSDAGRYAPIPSVLRNSARLPLFHQLDVRIDKEWVFRSWKLGAYLEVQNAYYNANAEGVAYNYDYSKSAYVRGLPILPVFGIKGEF